MSPTLHQLHQFSQRMIATVRARIPIRGTIPKVLADELWLAESLPVVLGYLRSVRTGEGMKLTDLMIANDILAREPTNQPTGPGAAGAQLGIQQTSEGVKV